MNKQAYTAQNAKDDYEKVIKGNDIYQIDFVLYLMDIIKDKATSGEREIDFIFFFDNGEPIIEKTGFIADMEYAKKILLESGYMVSNYMKNGIIKGLRISWA